VAKAAGNRKSPFLWLPRQRPTLQIENVMNELPKEQQDQTRKLMRAAFRLSTAEEGEKRLEQIARQLEHDYSSAARSLREGMKEMFTLQRLKIPASLHKCLATTNLIESPHSGIRKRTRNVCRWRDVDMVERWAASAWLLTEKNFRRIDGHTELWTLAALLGREISSSKNQKVA
jgi:putative transposase